MLTKTYCQDFSFETEHDEAYQLIKIHGRFIARNILEVRNAFFHAIDPGIKHLLFDLGSCFEMDTSAVGVLSHLNKELQDSDGSMGFIGPNDQILEIITKTGLLRFSHVYPTRKSAEQHLSKPKKK